MCRSNFSTWIRFEARKAAVSKLASAANKKMADVRLFYVQYKGVIILCPSKVGLLGTF